MDKDQSIITQVAAKIAADLTINNKTVADFTATFLDVKDVMMDVIYGNTNSGTQEEAQVLQAFPQATQAHSIQVVGKQHGELPDWLITACKADGITKIYDNRDGLADNPKRPWFKAVENKEKAYWPPRGK